MPLPIPNLDDRTFQDIVNEARSKIPLYCPEWTDHNLSDPGITLIELFAWMTELIIYRLNKVPDKNYVKFLELIGVTLTPANPASTGITFRLTAPQPNNLTIPGGTEVATVRTETQEAIVFTTDEDLDIIPPDLDYFLISRSDLQFDDYLPVFNDWEVRLSNQVDGTLAVDLFNSPPEPGNAFYFGFSVTRDLRRAVLALTLNCQEHVVHGFNPSNPPLLWEYWDGAARDWVSFERQYLAEAWLESDGTRGLSVPGQVILHIPETASPTSVGLRESYWIRCRITPFTQEQGSYEVSPRLGSVLIQSLGGTVMASNVSRVTGEILGISNGKPGQAMSVSRANMLPLGPGETVEVEGENEIGWEEWQQVSDFSRCGPDDQVFICDPVAGQIMFGPAVRSPRGGETRHGAVLPRGAHVRLSAYRNGGGPKGNVGSGTLTVLKSSIPYVASVTNRRAATGGVDPESIESAKMRGPQSLRTLNRAVTVEDFEHLAREASPSVGRAHCVQPQEIGGGRGITPGIVQVLLVPTLSTPQEMVTPEVLRLPRQLLDQVKDYLDERRLLTAIVVVSEPDYVWVSVEARVKVSPAIDARQVQQAVERRLYQFIHPISGGSEAKGWPFGRSLFVSELYSQIQAVPGVEYTDNLKIFPVNPISGERDGEVQVMVLPPSGLLCSHGHTVIPF